MVIAEEFYATAINLGFDLVADIRKVLFVTGSQFLPVISVRYGRSYKSCKF